LSKLETLAEVRALAAELRDRYGKSPPEVERLIAAASLRLLGTQLGVERITLQDNSARVSFRTGVVPRLTTLQGAFRDQQVETEVKRTAPLSLVIRRRGARSLTEILTSALEALQGQRAVAA
jgi:transcription-repair coupling factor (superfamily II helicase)